MDRVVDLLFERTIHYGTQTRNKNSCRISGCMKVALIVTEQQKNKKLYAYCLVHGVKKIDSGSFKYIMTLF
jgi:hypothetical protein